MSIQRFKECRTCGKQEPRRWTEADLYQCESCQADTRRAIRDMITQIEDNIVHNAVTQSDEQLRQAKRVHDMVQGWNPTHPKNVAAVQTQAQKAAQHRDPRAAQIARAMAQDPRPAARGTQQDPISDPMHILNPLNPISPVSPLNPLNDWDSSSHRNYEASSVSSVCDDSSRHTSHSSGYESSSSYDSGSDSSSYSSGGCD